MGIPSQIARLILREHRLRPITRKFLSIGRQTVYLTPSQAVALVQAELGIKSHVNADCIEIDQSTRASNERGFISDRAFYSLFCDAEYHCLDQSAYENADIVFNLCNANLPSELESSFDFIFDGSTLDNVFDPAAALRNLTRLSRVRGRLFHVDRTSRRHNVYVAFALSWFHDYYSINQFDDCQVYLAQWDDDQFTSPWDFYHFSPLWQRDGVAKFYGQDAYFYPWRHAHCVVIAEKGAQSTWNKNPIQFEYRANTPHEYIKGDFETLAHDLSKADIDDPYLNAARRFRRSERPSYLFKPCQKLHLPSNRVEYAPEITYCGSDSAIRD
jgi:hypothetical protein